MLNVEYQSMRRNDLVNAKDFEFPANLRDS